MINLNKTKIAGIIVLAITALFLSSCSSLITLKVIPKETNVVSVIDFYFIIKRKAR